MTRTPVAILGAPGAVGQRFIALLHDHPTFEITELVGKSSAGQPYGQAANWVIEGDVPPELADLTVKGPDQRVEADVVFSALPGGVAGPIETQLAKQGKAVFTNAKDHRMDREVPLVIPDINPDHLDLVADRDGFVVANPNCSAVVATTPLKPLHDAYGLLEVRITTLQALSGAGYPGVPSLDAVANVIPYIGNEEDKIETEPTKILGRVEGTGITHLDVPISATATRVPVPEGHTCVINVTLDETPSPEEAAEVLAGYRAPDPVPTLPTAPGRTIAVTEKPDRPQPKRDALAEDGMGVVVGRIRSDPLGSLKLVVLGSNTVRGAAGCSVLNAELAQARDLLG